MSDANNKNPIDQLSVMLGGIKADIDHIKTSTDATKIKVDRTHDGMISTNASLKSAHKRIDGVEEDIKEDVMPPITDYKNQKQQGIGRTSVLSVVFGFVGAFLMKIAAGALGGF